MSGVNNMGQMQVQISFDFATVPLFFYLLFRPDKNIERANRTNRRICIPEIPEEDFLQAIKTVVKVDESWIPTKPGTSLYIRPFIIATDPFL